jgi:hypothetical protein
MKYLVPTVTNKNYLHYEVKGRLNFRRQEKVNLSIQNILYSHTRHQNYILKCYGFKNL